MNATPFDDGLDDGPIPIPYAGPYTVDPEEALLSEDASGPVAIVSEDYHDDRPDFEVELETDPDGYWFGVPRDWTFEVESIDPNYPPRRILRQMIEQTTISWAVRETTVSLERHLLQIYQPILARRDRIVASSTDGERIVVLTKHEIKRKITRDALEEVP